MHEGTLIRELVGKVNEIATAEGAARVVSVSVSVGDFSHCSADHLREHFVQESAGTLADGADLKIHAVGSLDDPMSLEIVLDSIELDIPERQHAGRA